ncbi:hypothetical protein GCM10020227_53080 [Streptomyces flavovirens]
MHPPHVVGAPRLAGGAGALVAAIARRRARPHVVRVGDSDAAPHIGFSTDNGTNWFQGSEPSGVTGGGTVAAAADGSGFVWSPEGAGVHHTTGYGTSWTASTGIPAGATVESDRRNPEKFYGFEAGTFYVSTDGGATFTAKATGLPAEGNVRFQALPGTEGDIWLAGGSDTGAYGLWRSTDSGATFTKSAGVEQADSVGFGKAAPGASYRTVFVSAKIGGVRGIFRSTDAGASWTRINDDAHQWGWTGAAITGDPGSTGASTSPPTGAGSRWARPPTAAAEARTPAPTPVRSSPRTPPVR